MWRHLNRCNIAVLRQQRQFIGGGNVEHMNALAVFAGDHAEARGAENCSFDIAPDRMARRITRHLKTDTIPQAEFVFAVKGGTARQFVR